MEGKKSDISRSLRTGQELSKKHLLFTFDTMAKGSKKSAKVAKTSTKPGGDSLPKFDENALSALTAKIEKGFGGSKDESQIKSDAVNGKQKEGKSDKKSKTANAKSKDKVPELVRGTKRDAQGNAKSNGKAAPKDKSAKSKYQNGDKDARAVLLEEILALGGTEEDLDLVADAFSSDEDEETKPAGKTDQSFKKDLAAFVAGLGIEGAVVAEDDEEEPVEEEQEEVDEEWEEASDVESSEIEAKVEPMKPLVAVTPVPASNDPNRLVSTVSVPVAGLADSQ